MPEITPEEELDLRFTSAVRALPGGGQGGPADLSAPVAAGTHLTGDQIIALFDAQAGSRHLDLAARYLRAEGHGFYTIGSAGHEGNAAVAAALRPSDPALLHYRSGAFYLARAAQVPGSEPLRDVLLGLVAAREEPIAGGRHKVFGNHALAVIPQTSTIASHLPRAVGIAFSIGRTGKLGVPSPWPADAITVASFGDASTSHSTATGAINAACRTAYQGLPMPLLLVCEDNGLGISVRTPDGWVAAAHSGRPALRYFSADGCDPVACFDAATHAAAYVRASRSPAFLHLKLVRFLGHAGSDAEISYRSQAEIAADYARDPLLATARLIVAAGLLSPAQVISRYEALRARVRTIADEVVTRRQLASRAEVTGPLAPHHPDQVARRAVQAGRPPARESAFGRRLPEDAGPLTLADTINRSLADGLAAYPELVVFGEDVGRKGGVYGVTRGLARRFGVGRVFDTLLDEQAILGLGLGAGLSGLLPVPEIQYLAYLHNAEDQLRGEAASLQFFSAGQYRNPMVVRVAGLGYQKGFGGHFHNDNAVGVLRDIPGLVIAVRPAPRTRRPCCAPAWPPPASTGPSASSWSRSRSTTPATCTSLATAPGCRPTPARTAGRRRTCPSGAAAATAAGPTSPWSRSGTGSPCRCGWRGGWRPAGSACGSSTCGGLLPCPPSSCARKPSGPGASWWSTRPAGPAASPRA